MKAANLVLEAVDRLLALLGRAMAMIPPAPKWGGWFPKVHPEDMAFCHRCGAHVPPRIYAEHVRACK